MNSESNRDLDFQAERITEQAKPPKITLKVSGPSNEHRPTLRTRRAKTKAQSSFQDDYDWELDDFMDDKSLDEYGGHRIERQTSISSFSEPDEPEIKAEKHFIIRVPEEISEEVKNIIAEKTTKKNIDITFHSNRKATFRLNQRYFSAKLLDLPTITESYKMMDKKQLLKVADICQMLLVEKEIDPRTEIKASRFVEQKDVISIDGLAPPLKAVSRRRFRPRISYSRINYLENEVLRLLKEDENAVSVSYELQDEQNDVLADNESAILREEDVKDREDLEGGQLGNVDESNISSESDSEDFDADLAAELDRGLKELEFEYSHNEDSNMTENDKQDGTEPTVQTPAKESDEELEDSEEDDASEDSDDNAMNSERKMQIKLLIEEVTNLESSIQRKRVDLDSAPNPIIKNRFEVAIKKLMSELESKKSQLESIRSAETEK
ncbi:hypothetical protein BB560_001000 [Smittium megazygosporum]|uniref:TAFII55 protein conserved region domain-containing protein n=1 Tax=Smittium megazygosporum TaxID=133381 RepID=A0A2T9ZIW7_9FUNG|nr:hypothetical protein BB560_001000 [Smittium megazygosporum]